MNLFGVFGTDRAIESSPGPDPEVICMCNYHEQRTRLSLLSESKTEGLRDTG
jgi:hypothetical protein